MKIFFKTNPILLLTFAFTLSSCIYPQAPAPVEAGNTGGTISIDDRSYTSAPYTPPSEQSVSNYQSSVSNSYAPVDVNASSHTVVKGDTVYNISKRYNISQENLRSLNSLVDNNISIGQVLKIKNSVVTTPIQTTNTITKTPSSEIKVTQATQSSTSTTGQQVNTSSSRNIGGVTWITPTKGNIIAQFNAQNKGIDISGTKGQSVLAAADGEVIYSGSDLEGYGKLIIIQHTPTLLSVYGNNDALLVKEKAKVKRGQQIARMGDTQSNRVKLHFEIRKDGVAVNPLNYLPTSN